MDIIVTTPKTEMVNSAKEAEACLKAGGGFYFRRFPFRRNPSLLGIQERVYYVEDGAIRGFAIVSEIEERGGTTCDTTGRPWWGGTYIYMPANSWKWIHPIPMKGFQGFRYVRYVGRNKDRILGSDGLPHQIDILGGWKDPRPEV